MTRGLGFFRDRRVFLTGHTGFKGAWLSRILIDAGAEVTGYALPAREPSLFALAQVESGMTSIIGDVLDMPSLQAAVAGCNPEVVIHLAAQPLVRVGYRDPRATYEINVMGTVNILECVRSTSSVRSFLNVTTDKVYKNSESEQGHREMESLDGFDPYANSKSCSELVTHSYRRSFFADGVPAVSTARSGNVIGGGDFAPDRVIADCIGAAISGGTIFIRNPGSIRPYQHVLEALFAYLMILEGQYEVPDLAGWYNVGPSAHDSVTTGDLATMFCECWGGDLAWRSVADEDAPPEAVCLRLDCSLLESVFGWQPRWGTRRAIQRTIEWTRAWVSGGDVPQLMRAQIGEYLA